MKFVCLDLFFYYSGLFTSILVIALKDLNKIKILNRESSAFKSRPGNLSKLILLITENRGKLTFLRKIKNSKAKLFNLKLGQSELSLVCVFPRVGLKNIYGKAYVKRKIGHSRYFCSMD